MAETTLPPPALEHLCDLTVQVGKPIEVGHGPQGLRRMIPILGWQVSGRLAGRVLPGGADYQLIVGGTAAQLDARYVLELDDGTRLFVHNRALRVASADVTARLLRSEPVPAAAVYFRCQPRFEAADPRWQWLNERQFVGTGERRPDTVLISFYCVL
jgi:hypothetical protein